jgi:integrase
LFTWAIDKGHADATPTTRIRPRSGNNKRQRTLSPAELIDVWWAATAVGGHYEKIVKLLILTGQRRDEIGGLTWREITEIDQHPRIDLPPRRTKNKLPHIVPLSRQALALLPPRPEHADRTVVFGRRHHIGFSGWSKEKRKLDEAIDSYVRRRTGEGMPRWVIHDLRRTFVTLMGELGFATPHVIEAIVNHVSGHKANVAGVYNKALYLEERRKGMEAWGDYVEGLTRRAPVADAAWKHE